MLEIRLAALGPDSIDFSTRLVRPELAKSLGPRFARSFPLLEGGWERLGYPDPIPHLWLELDDSSFDDSFPDGDVGRRFPAPLLITQFGARPSAEWLATRWLAELSSFRPTRESAELRSLSGHLRRCLHCLPSPGRVLYGFDLAARGGAPLRLELVGLPASALADYLAQIADPRPARALRRMLDGLGPIERPHLSFDLDSGGVASRIGFEISFRRQPDREPGWRRILDRLVAVGLCDPAQRDALLAWPGVDHLRSAIDRWPTGGRGHCVRCLSHLKLVLEPDRDPIAKAYLLFENVR